MADGEAAIDALSGQPLRRRHRAANAAMAQTLPPVQAGFISGTGVNEMSCNPNSLEFAAAHRCCRK